MNSNINRALIFQGGGSLGAYKAGVYKAVHEDISEYFRTEGRGNEPISYVKENKTWEGSSEKLIAFWEYLSTQS